MVLGGSTGLMWEDLLSARTPPRPRPGRGGARRRALAVEPPERPLLHRGRRPAVPLRARCARTACSGRCAATASAPSSTCAPPAPRWIASARRPTAIGVKHFHLPVEAGAARRDHRRGAGVARPAREPPRPRPLQPRRPARRPVRSDLPHGVPALVERACAIRPATALGFLGFRSGSRSRRFVQALRAAPGAAVHRRAVLAGRPRRLEKARVPFDPVPRPERRAAGARVHRDARRVLDDLRGPRRPPESLGAPPRPSTSG